ncbi:MAG: pentapeptide repeat-containing protein [Saprospiraceae bacterium]|nr:pentapeptide repeat-containing protein [Candidatus Defluviibacterium haderslevense]
MDNNKVEQSNINTGGGDIAGGNIDKSITNKIYQNIKSVSRFDKSGKKNHFNVFPNSAYHINDLFIFPNSDFIDIIDITEENIVEVNENEELLKYIIERKITFIIGGYGVGKSILSKKINFDLRENCKVLYLDSTELSIYVEGRDLEDEYDLEDKPTLIIIDSIDELNNVNSATGTKASELVTLFAKNLKSNHKLLITTRLFQNDVKKSISMYATILFDLDIFSFGVITIKSFSKTHIKEWIENYFWFKEKIEHKYLSFEYSEIKRWKKGLQSALHNPLMLFLFCEHFINNIKEINYDIYDIYNLYSDFVNKTVKGKFDLETKKGSKQIPSQIQDEYRGILKKISFSILRHNYLNQYELNPENEFIDTNIQLFSISENEIEVTLKTEIEHFISISAISKEQEAPLKYNLLNCYFFEFYLKQLKFKDNNILFFFIAEKYYEIFSDFLLKDLDVFYNNFLEHCNIPLNAIIIEMLLQKLKSDENLTNIPTQLEAMIQKGYFINFEEEKHLNAMTFYKVNCDILLSIIYLNLNKPNTQFVNYFVKRLIWYTSSIKLIDSRILYLVKRFFKECSLIDIEIRRINLKGFNFDNSNFKNVKFIQNKIVETRFNYANFYNSEFYLSEIEKSEFNGIKGDFKFNSCVIKHLIIDDFDELKILFNRCLVQDITFRSENKFSSKKLSLEFANCDLRQIKINRTDVDNIYLKECFFDTFDFKSSIIRNFAINNSICRSKKTYDIDGQSEIKNETIN